MVVERLMWPRLVRVGKSMSSPAKAAAAHTKMAATSLGGVSKQASPAARKAVPITPAM
jgi:hypothetical protein